MGFTGAAELVRSISRKTPHEQHRKDEGAPINRTLSHASQHVLSHDDGLSYPSLTSYAPPTDTYQVGTFCFGHVRVHTTGYSFLFCPSETETGLVSAAEAERQVNALAEATGGEEATPHSSASSIHDSATQKKGGIRSWLHGLKTILKHPVTPHE